MSQQVRIVETPDRYLVIDVDTGESLDGDRVGFTYEDDARDWAESRMGYEIIE